MTDHREDHVSPEAEPPTKFALRAGFAYLVVLGVVLSGLAMWFVLTRTA